MMTAAIYAPLWLFSIRSEALSLAWNILTGHLPHHRWTSENPRQVASKHSAISTYSYDQSDRKHRDLPRWPEIVNLRVGARCDIWPLPPPKPPVSFRMGRTVLMTLSL